MDEVATMGVEIGKLKEQMNEMTTQIMNEQKMLLQNMEMEIEIEVFKRVEEILMETNAGFKAMKNKMIIIVLLFGAIMFALLKVV